MRPRSPASFRAMLAAGLFAVVLAAGPAAAEMRQFGGLIFPVPPQFDDPVGSDTSQRAMWSNLPDDRCEYCRILIGPEAKASGPISRWLDQNREAFVDEDERGDFKVGKPATNTPLGKRDAAMLAQSDGSDMQVLVAIEAGGRFHLLGFDGDGGDEDELAETGAVLTETFLPWLATLRFRAEGAPSLLPEPVAGGMEGLWWGWRSDVTLGTDMMMKTQNSHRTVTFWPDGTFYDGTPPLGLAPPDRAALDAGRDTDWGNYVRQGDGMVLTYADGRTEKAAREGDGWATGGFTLNRVEPLPDGTRIDGRISWISFSGFAPGTGMTGGAGGGGETVFHPDGRYEGSSFGTAFGSFAEGGGFSVGGGDDAAGGRYEVHDGLLVFAPQKGRAERAVLAFSAEDSVMLGTDFLEGSVSPPR